MILLENRHRIAPELHDHVLQRLFAGGMTMQAMAAVVGEPHAERLEQLITDTDETTVRIRSVIHGLNARAVAADLLIRPLRNGHWIRSKILKIGR